MYVSQRFINDKNEGTCREALNKLEQMTLLHDLAAESLPIKKEEAWHILSNAAWALSGSFTAQVDPLILENMTPAVDAFLRAFIPDWIQQGIEITFELEKNRAQ